MRKDCYERVDKSKRAYATCGIILVRSTCFYIFTNTAGENISGAHAG